MARFVNKSTGSIVDVDDVTAESLGPEYEPESSAGKKQPAAKPGPSK